MSEESLLSEVRKSFPSLSDDQFRIMVVMSGVAVYAILATPGERPAHLKDMPPIHPRTAGPWRGKGSFGHRFGSQVKHRSR